MTAALDAITRLDDSVPLPGDVEIADVFDRHASADWYRVEQRMHPPVLADCVICGEEGTGPECDGCVVDWDARMKRAADQ